MQRNLLVVDSRSFELEWQSVHCLVKNQKNCYAGLIGGLQTVNKILKKRRDMKLGEVHRWLPEQREQ